MPVPVPDSDFAEARRLLAAGDEPTRVRGVRMLRDGTSDPDGAARELVSVLTDPGRYVPHAARGALQTLGDAALPALLDGLGSSDARIRSECVWALARPQGPHAPDVVAAVSAVAGDAEESVRRAVSAALGRCGGPSEARADRLAEFLDDPAPQVRAEAADACGHEPALAALLVERLLDALEDGKPPVRVAAARALESVAPPAGAAERVRALLVEEVVENPRLRLAVLLERWETAS